jgi:hypothetical protein
MRRFRIRFLNVHALDQAIAERVEMVHPLVFEDASRLIANHLMNVD